MLQEGFRGQAHWNHDHRKLVNLITLGPQPCLTQKCSTCCISIDCKVPVSSPSSGQSRVWFIFLISVSWMSEKWYLIIVFKAKIKSKSPRARSLGRVLIFLWEAALINPQAWRQGHVVCLCLLTQAVKRNTGLTAELPTVEVSLPHHHGQINCNKPAAFLSCVCRVSGAHRAQGPTRCTCLAHPDWPCPLWPTLEDLKLRSGTWPAMTKEGCKERCIKRSVLGLEHPEPDLLASKIHELRHTFLCGNRSPGL